MALGVGLRLWQYLANPSIWVDEAAIARNVLDRDLWRLLTSPLDYAQVAPPAWLAVIDMSSHVLGTGERSLRLLPLVSGILTVPASFVLSKRITSHSNAVLVTLLVALAVPLVLFSVNLKPYATDALVAVCTVILADTASRETMNRRRAIWLSIAGLVAVSFSSSAVFGTGSGWSRAAFLSRAR